MKRGYKKIESDGRHLQVNWFEGLHIQVCGKDWMYEVSTARGIGVSLINSEVLREIIVSFGFGMIDYYRWPHVEKEVHYERL